MDGNMVLYELNNHLRLLMSYIQKKENKQLLHLNKKHNFYKFQDNNIFLVYYYHLRKNLDNTIIQQYMMLKEDLLELVLYQDCRMNYIVYNTLFLCFHKNKINYIY